MRITVWRRILMLAPAAWLTGQLAAQDTAELLNRMKAMEDRIKALEAEVQLRTETDAGPWNQPGSASKGGRVASTLALRTNPVCPRVSDRTPSPGITSLELA